MAVVYYLDVELVEQVRHPFAVTAFGNATEPIPTFKPHNEHSLDSALNLPRQTFAVEELYKTLADKAAMRLLVGLLRSRG